MDQVSIQVQTVLYHNDKAALAKSISSIANAVRIERKDVGAVSDCVLKYGDASREPLYSNEELEEINETYKGLLKVDYQFFNCNTGTSKGHNLLFRECRTDYVMIINPDVIVSTRYFIMMLEPFRRNPEIGQVEARQTPIEHPKDYNTKTFETAWASGACNAVPTEIFRSVGAYDEDTFFMYCDDVDVSWRIRLAGYKVYYQPAATAYHAKQVASDGSWQPTDTEQYYSAEAALFMAHKWSNPKLVTRYLWDFKRSKDKNLMKAANEYLKRKKSGTLPTPLDKEHKVAKFVEGSGYAKHRFVL